MNVWCSWYVLHGVLDHEEDTVTAREEKYCQDILVAVDRQIESLSPSLPPSLLSGVTIYLMIETFPSLLFFALHTISIFLLPPYWQDFHNATS